MNKTITESDVVGIDIAKNVFQVYTVSKDGEVINKQIKRRDFLASFRNRPPLVIGMEACGGSQHWARELQKLGHEVRLMPPKAVKPFVTGMKNDRNDARGIYQAVLAGVRRVAVKTANEQSLDTLITMRLSLVKEKVRKVNHIRGLLMEYGMVMPKSVKWFLDTVDEKINDLSELGEVSDFVIDQFRELVKEVEHLIDREKEISRQIEIVAKQCKNYQRFLEVDGVGKVTAAKLCVLLADPSIFKNGRQFAAYIGLVPMSYGSGGHNVTTSIPRINCDRYSRSLLCECAHSIDRNKKPGSWAFKIRGRKPPKVAVIAIANRLARRLWAMAAKGEKWTDIAPVPQQ